MDTMTVKKPKLDKPLKYAYSVSEEDLERFKRKKQRAEELGIDLFILDEDEIPKELKELEYYIIDNFLDMDQEVPEDIKDKYLELKKRLITVELCKDEDK